MLVGLLACAHLARPYVPVDVSAPTSRVARVAALAGVRAAVAARALPTDLATTLDHLGVPVLAAPADAAAVLAPEVEGGPPGAADPWAYVMFTSGSTGEPKGVPIRRSAVDHFAEWLLAEQRPRPGAEVVLHQAPFSFDLSLMDLCLALGSGGTLFAVTRELVADPRALFAALGGSRLTIWVSTPSFARLVLAEPRFGEAMLPELRRFVFCGEPLAPAIASALLQRFPRAEVWNTYGPTEATVAVTSIRVTAAMALAGTPLPVGHPAPGCRVWVSRPDLAPVADGERGEIVIAGPQVSPGYLEGSATGSATCFCDLPPTLGGGRGYRTGDSGYLAEGLLYCEGRLDRQVKLHGYRLEPEEIEQRLRGLPGVDDAAVVVVMRGGAPDHLAAFAAMAAVGDSDPADEFARGRALRTGLGQSLPSYALPRVIRVLTALPLTPNGKVDRRALESML